MASISASTGRPKATQGDVNMMRNIMIQAINNLPRPMNPWDEQVQWTFMLHEATAKKVKEWLNVQKSEGRMSDMTVKSWLNSPLDDFAVFSIRNLISENMQYADPGDGLFPWDRRCLFGKQKPPISIPADGYPFAQFVSSMSSNEKVLDLPGTPACQRGLPHLPGYIHFRDIVLYRIIEEAMKYQGIHSLKIIRKSFPLCDVEHEDQQCQTRAEGGPQLLRKHEMHDFRQLTFQMRGLLCESYIVLSLNSLGNPPTIFVLGISLTAPSSVLCSTGRFLLQQGLSESRLDRQTQIRMQEASGDAQDHSGRGLFPSYSR